MTGHELSSALTKTCVKSQPTQPQRCRHTTRAASATWGHSATWGPLVLANLGNFWHLQEKNVICLSGGGARSQSGEGIPRSSH